MTGRTVQLDLRAVLPVAVLGVVVLTIIVVELCGREEVEPQGPAVTGPTATVGPTFTPGPSPTTGPDAATATAALALGGEDRDQTRQLDLADIQAALEDFFADFGRYPDTGDNIQSLCVFEDTDAGCVLRDRLDPIPTDPLGDPVENGYFYQSEGTRYTLFAIRESELLPECDEHPTHLERFASLLCLRGPAVLPSDQ